MPNGVLLSLPDLETVTIQDFTAGVFNGGLSINTFGTEAPVGAACQAFRCIARKGLGLIPLPSYSTFYTKSVNVTGAGSLTLGDMVAVPEAGGPQIALNWIYNDGTATPWKFNLEAVNNVGAVFASYSSQSVGQPVQPLSTLAPSFFLQGGRRTTTIFTYDPVATASGNAVWVILDNPTGAGSLTGTTPQPFQKCAYVTSRMVLMGNPNTANFGGGMFYDEFITSDTQSATNVTPIQYFSPGEFSEVGAWGSVSTGEFAIIGQNGGLIIISGDIQLPSSAILLPAVRGTGNVWGRAVPAPAGLIYTTADDGVWVWNGGNTSQKISMQVLDSQFTRTDNVGFGIGKPLVNEAVWGNWVFFPNNWVFDCEGGGWWQCEDPTINNFQVFAAGTDGLFSAVGGVTRNTTGAMTMPISQWTRSSTPANSYSWTSTPLPFPGSLVSIRAVEICASNTTSSPATIKVTPTPPPRQTGFSNQNSGQSVTFTIPAKTAGYRASQSLGYTDYNVCINVLATGAILLAAPTLHDLTIGINKRPSST